MHCSFSGKRYRIIEDTPAVIRDLHQGFDLGELLKTGERPRETSHVRARSFIACLGNICSDIKALKEAVAPCSFEQNKTLLEERQKSCHRSGSMNEYHGQGILAQTPCPTPSSYMFLQMALPKAEQDTSVAPSIWRARS